MQKISVFGANYREIEIGKIINLGVDKPLLLSNGNAISNFPIAYQTYGELNQDKSNAILICHALTGDQYVASTNPVNEKDGWWKFIVGEGLAIDTNKFFVICSNVIGGCMGSFGPKEINQDTGKIYGGSFPAININDIVNAQNLLIEHFGIKKLYAVVGGSTGGMQALTWSIIYPQKINKIIALACSYRHSPQNIAFHEVGRQAILTDPNFCQGNYLLEKTFPSRGLAVARMTAHITYLSESSLQRKFGRNLQNNNHQKIVSIDSKHSPEFEVENYLHYQGLNFIERFDPNSYIAITKAVDYFDLEKDFNNNLSLAFANSSHIDFCIISFSDDWLFPACEAKKLTMSILACNAKVSFVTINSCNGHDSFLVKNEPTSQAIANFLN